MMIIEILALQKYVEGGEGGSGHRTGNLAEPGRGAKNSCTKRLDKPNELCDTTPTAEDYAKTTSIHEMSDARTRRIRERGLS